MDRELALSERRAPHPRAGFTLIELVVVMAIMSVLALSVSFSAARMGAGQQSDVAGFSAQFERLYERAIMGRAPLALSLSDRGWQMLRPDDSTPDRWIAVGRVRVLRGEARFETADLTPARRTGAPLLYADLVFLPNGQSTPFRVAFISAQGVTRCTSDGWTGVKCAPD